MLIEQALLYAMPFHYLQIISLFRVFLDLSDNIIYFERRVATTFREKKSRMESIRNQS